MKKVLILLAITMSIIISASNFVDAKWKYGPCDWCYGSGECRKCDGKGYTWETNTDDPDWWHDEQVECYECRGTGVCPYCKGTGDDIYGR